MAKRQAAVNESEETSQPDTPEEPAQPPVETSASEAEAALPKLFQQAKQRWGANTDLWAIWVRDEFEAWQNGGPAPTGELPAEINRPTVSDR